MRHQCSLYSFPYYRRDDLVLAHGARIVAATVIAATGADNDSKKSNVGPKRKNDRKKTNVVPGPKRKNDHQNSESLSHNERAIGYTARQASRFC
jgi:hypothetical protein